MMVRALVAMRTGDSAKIAEPYEDQAVFVTLDGSASRGRAQIEAMTKERFARAGTVVSTTIEPHHIVRNGDLAVEMGAAEIHRQGANGALVVTGGGYLTVWRRQPDGGWKIHRNLVLP